ncbi:MAG TPA: alpha/beta hydrolase-fold protein [archaeon]|nr:alpha/beta hydrolase-fold protein [archaeon]
MTGLKGDFSQGQVFLTWQEPPGDHGGTFNIYMSPEPIKGRNLDQANLLAAMVEAYSARDWWQDSATYFKEGQVEPAGFVIREGGERLDPAGGLFVHTVGEGDPESAYYAVTMTVGGAEDRKIVAGSNSLKRPLSGRQMPIKPIWLGVPGEKPGPGSAEGLPAIFSLHGRGGSEPQTWLAFGTREMGWREGLPFKFHAVLKEGHLLIAPTDRTWVCRTLLESWDARDHFSPAIDTFWYGYNDRIYDRDSMLSGTPTNFTERRNLWILSWAQEYFRCDPARIVLEGGSMGGCGTLSWGLRHPELFSALMAAVPLVGYFDQEWGGSEKRLTPFCGPLDRRDSEGTILRQRMDSRTVLADALEKGIDLPFLVISNGRQDGSIPWRPNPRYYRALNESRQGFIAGWDNGVHSNCMDHADPWFKNWQDPEYLLRFSLKESFPALSNFSLNDNPGNGEPADGDLTGYINFGLEWKEIRDEKDQYALTLFFAGGKPRLPATVDITLRRVQRFHPAPGEEVVLIDRAPGGREIIRKTAPADRTGHITFEKFRLTDIQGNRLVVLRKNKH